MRSPPPESTMESHGGWYPKADSPKMQPAMFSVMQSGPEHMLKKKGAVLLLPGHKAGLSFAACPGARGLATALHFKISARKAETRKQARCRQRVGFWFRLRLRPADKSLEASRQKGHK